MGDGEDPSAGPDKAGVDPSTQRAAVRERYGSIADASGSDACCEGSTSCCGDEEADESNAVTRLGYDETDVAAAETAAELGLGCGNPTAIASLEAGETVLDLGAGGGFDCFLAAREVGPEGRIVGVDMTPEMVETARENREETGADNVEFRLGEIEHLPVADGTVDVVISNCVVNLSPDKGQVFHEALRVLRPGGRVVISDVVQTAPFPASLEPDPASVAACVAGASRIVDLEGLLHEAGFTDVAIEPEDDSDSFISDWDEERDLSEFLVAATIEAQKPAGGAADRRTDTPTR